MDSELRLSPEFVLEDVDSQFAGGNFWRSMDGKRTEVTAWGHPSWPDHSFRVALDETGSVVEFAVTTTASEPVTATSLRDYPITELVQSARKALTKFLVGAAKGDFAPRLMASPELADYLTVEALILDRPDLVDLAWKMSAYVHHCEESPHRPSAATADRFKVSSRAVQKWRKKAEAAGLFVPAPNGERGGWLTELAVAILDRAEGVPDGDS